jgi:hypothetical protein
MYRDRCCQELDEWRFSAKARVTLHVLKRKYAGKQLFRTQNNAKERKKEEGQGR